MLLCFDVGNSQVYGGFYEDKKFSHNFRINTKIGWSSDQLGIFLRSFCREHNVAYEKVNEIAVSSVVPSFDYHLKNACLKYFKVEPLFIKSGIKTGVSVAKYKAFSEIGADLICSAVGALEQYPDNNLLLVDMGTATTITAVNKKKEFITGLIIPGIKTQVASLAHAAEKLFTVELVQPKTIMAKDTSESIQAGLYYGHLGAMRLLLKKLAKEALQDQEHKIIATGGFARLFTRTKLFDVIDSDLVLKGLVKIVAMNTTKPIKIKS